jgi:hypothetical protein
MKISDLYYWGNDKAWNENLDWIEVVDVELAGGYEWDEFHAWYSPSQRVY